MVKSLFEGKISFPLWFAGIGFFVSFFTFYPGLMSSDTIDQYNQSQTFEFFASHPPLMVWIWSILNSIWEGPQVMLITQLAFYWAAVYFLLSALPTTCPKSARFGIYALLLAPNVVNFLGVIWKDVWLMSLWIFALSFTYNKRTKGQELSGTEKIWLLIAVAVGALMRWNSMLIAGPLMLYVVEGKPFLSNWKRTIGFYIVAAFGVLALNSGINWILRTPHSNAIQSLIVQDLGGILVKTGKNPFPFELSEEEIQQVKTCWNPRNHSPLIWGECGYVRARGSANPSNLPMIKAWLNAIKNHPLVYLENRLHQYGLFFLSSEATWMDSIAPNDKGLVVKPHGLLYVLRAYMRACEGSVLMRPITWLLLALFLLLVLQFKKNLPSVLKNFEQTVVAISFLNFASYIPLVVTMDFRYSYVSILMTTFGLCILLGNFAILKK